MEVAGVGRLHLGGSRAGIVSDGLDIGTAEAFEMVKIVLLDPGIEGIDTQGAIEGLDLVECKVGLYARRE